MGNKYAEESTRMGRCATV